MSAAAVVTIIAAVVVVLVLAVFLLAIARVLVGVSRQLEAVIAAVGTIATRTEPVNSVVDSINGNLDTARNALSSLLESKVGANGASQLVASVDPLAEPGGTLLRDERPRTSYHRAVDEPAPTEVEPGTHEPDPDPDPDSGLTHPTFPGRGGGEIRLRDNQDP